MKNLKTFFKLPIIIDKKNAMVYAVIVGVPWAWGVISLIVAIFQAIF